MRGPYLAILLALATVAGHLRAQFVYVANGGGSNNVSAYRIDENGALRQIPGSPFAAENLPSSIALHPTGRFAYVVNESSNNVSAYRIERDGSLTPIPNSPFQADIDPHDIAIDPEGKFAYVVNAVANNISAYQIAEDGALAPISGSPFPAAGFPRSLAIERPESSFIAPIRSTRRCQDSASEMMESCRRSRVLHTQPESDHFP
jgi:6-phosphogluconolactonase (cycloisomerase 2 family)